MNRREFLVRRGALVPGMMRIAFLFLTVLVTLSSVAAEPVWPLGRAGRMNDTVRFEAEFAVDETKGLVFEIAALDLYQVRINGRFVAFGPARAAKGFVRPDVIALDAVAKKGTNLLEVLVSSYGMNTSSQARNIPFFEACVRLGGTKVVESLASGGGFRCFETGRIQKSVRFSCQRGFTEVWREPFVPERPLPLERVLSRATTLPRRVPYPRYERFPLIPVAARRFAYDESKAVKPHALLDSRWQPEEHFKTEELDSNLYFDLQRFVTTGKHNSESGHDGVRLRAGEAQMYKTDCEETGFIEVEVYVKAPSVLVMSFDERLHEGEISPCGRRMSLVGACEWRIEKPGWYRLLTLEPYSVRYLETLVRKGELAVGKVDVIAYRSPLGAELSCPTSDPELTRIWTAAIETLRQNAVDLFTDCPSRERGGYPCDAFFTGRAAELIDSAGVVEKSFFENYLLPEKFDFMPEGMLPLCYPSDLSNGLYIPNWAMWLFIELKDYVAFTGDRRMAEDFLPKFERLVKFFENYLNSDGLLENLPGWVFVEWSKANEFTKGVNYPSNMVWAEALERMGMLYGRTEWSERAAKMRETIRMKSWNGFWFKDCDWSEAATETCQYYAFALNVATAERYPELWRKITDEFGPERAAKKLYPEVYPSNAFIGNFLRLYVLSKSGRSEQVLAEVKRYFLYMAEETGTLWEHVGGNASCNHGFAAYAAWLIAHNVKYHQGELFGGAEKSQ